RAFALVTLLALGYAGWRIPIIGSMRTTWPDQPWHMILPSVNTLRLAILYFGVVGLLLCYTGHSLLKPLRDRRLCYLGQISYGLYLYHPLVFTAGTLLHVSWGLNGSWWLDALKLAALIGVAALSWTYIERPILSLRDRFAEREGPGSSGMAG